MTNFEEFDLFDKIGAASAPVSSGEPASAANIAAPCQFNKKMPPLPKNHHLMPFSVSNDDLLACKIKLAQQAIWLKEQTFISETTGEIRSFFDFTMSANHSKKYYAEVWNRTNTLSDFMLNSDHRIAFLTITLNGCFRRALLGDYSGFSGNDYSKLSQEFCDKMLNNEPCDIRDLVSLLNFQWHAFFKRILKYLKGQRYFYIRAFEPHKKDGVPHIHALISYPVIAHEKILKAYKDIFNAPQNLKSTYLSKEQKANGEINGFQWTISNPAGYVLKYINKSFINCLENGELNHQQAWYIKYKVRRFTTSRHQIPLWIYRKINFFRHDFFELCSFKDNDDWACEWDFNEKYFRLSNIKTKELINFENGVLEHSIDGRVLHVYKKEVAKKFHRKLDIPKHSKDNRLIDKRAFKKPVNRMKDYELISYFKDLPVQNTAHYALCVNELIKRGLNKIFGIPNEKFSLNDAHDEIDVDFWSKKLGAFSYIKYY